MNFTEKELEDWLYENPNEFLPGREFHWCGRQVRVASGIIDLLGFEKIESHDYSIHVVELKAEPAKSEHLTQVCRYAADIRSCCQKQGDFVYVTRTLIAPGYLQPKFQFEADSVGVLVREVQTEFNITGKWAFTATARGDYSQTNEKVWLNNIKPMVDEHIEARDLEVGYREF